jgi:hypothetical protein
VCSDQDICRESRVCYARHGSVCDGATWKLFSLGDARDEDVDPSVVCPEVDTEPFSVNFEYTGSTTPASGGMGSGVR